LLRSRRRLMCCAWAQPGNDLHQRTMVRKAEKGMRRSLRRWLRNVWMGVSGEEASACSGGEASAACSDVVGSEDVGSVAAADSAVVVDDAGVISASVLESRMDSDAAGLSGMTGTSLLLDVSAVLGGTQCGRREHRPRRAGNTRKRLERAANGCDLCRANLTRAVRPECTLPTCSAIPQLPSRMNGGPAASPKWMKGW
jgi:hypothetical protein